MGADVKINGVYKHYKGGIYRVIELAIHTETNEEMVIYKSLKDGRVWARPKKMFTEQVMIDNKLINRFTLMSSL